MRSLHPARGVRWLAILLLVFLGTLHGAVHAAAGDLRDEEIDQVLAPIALYPDSLLSQVLMASTYPADVAAAAAWSKVHPDVKGDAAIQQVADQPWEPAVQSLTAFPQVLAMMDARPDDVQKLGDAFLADPGRVMDRIQFLRDRAQQAGHLKSTSEQVVSTSNEGGRQAIVIEPAQPQQVYVPVYQPSVVYGVWPYPAYPPYYWAPPPYYYPGAAFAAGFVWGAAVVGINNALWGGFGWGGNSVNINVNRFNSIHTSRTINSGNFNFNPNRRGNVPYRDAGSRARYGGDRQFAAAQDRQGFRGKDGREAQRNAAAQQLKARGADPAAGRQRLQGVDRARADQAARNTGRANFAGGGAGNRATGGAARNGGNNFQQVRHDNALSGVRNSGASRANADRGRTSRASSAQHPQFAGGGGSARGGGMHAGGGGGGMRGGGGMHGGGGHMGGGGGRHR